MNWEDAGDSEIRYRELFESTGDAIMLLGPRGFLQCNQATLRLFGYRSEQDFLTKHPSEVSPPRQPCGTDSRRAADAHIERAYRERTHRFEWLHRREDGTEFMADVLLARVDLQSGPILQAVVRDISERKRVEQELRDAHEQLEQHVQERTRELAAANAELRQEVIDRRRAEQELALERFLLRTLMDHAPDFIFFKDRNSRIIRISRALANYYGLDDPDAAIGKNDFDFYDEELAHQYREAEQEVMRLGRILENLEEEQVWPDGRVTWLLTNKVPLLNPDGQVMGTFGISRDITLRKVAESNLQLAMQAAEAANRAKSDFLANMSHEIRTPMNAIIGLTELVLDTSLDETQREYLRMVRDSSESLMCVINDILDFSKVEAGKLELRQASFESREMFGDTVKSLALRAHDKGLELICRVDASVPTWLVGDACRLRQVIVNLVGNAIKFTDHGEVLVDVECTPPVEDQVQVTCRVADTGIGIPAEKQRLIFHAFEQADNSTTRRFGGTGLGLAISSRLVRAMGGMIQVHSQEGQGSTFEFTAQLRVGQAVTAPAQVARQGMIGARVLVVDDNATNCRILLEMLTNWRMLPQAASSVSAALQQLDDAARQGAPLHLILTDANMPGQDGFELARQVAQHQHLRETIIMMLSSGGRPGDISRCQELGIRCYLLKPVKQSELFDAIVEALAIDDQDQAAHQDSVQQPDVQLPTLRILLAEDSLVNQKLAVGLLERSGHRVDVVMDGCSAVAAVREKEYDLVLMDVQMPEMDGLEAARVIRQEELDSGKHVPIVAMTAHAMKGDKERCLAAGMDGYVAKPIRAAEMFRTMGQVLLTDEN